MQPTLDQLLDELGVLLMKAGELLQQEQYGDLLALCDKMLEKYRHVIRFHEFGYLAYFMTARAVFEAHARYRGGLSQGAEDVVMHFLKLSLDLNPDYGATHMELGLIYAGFALRSSNRARRPELSETAVYHLQRASELISGGLPDERKAGIAELVRRLRERPDEIA